MHLGIAVLFIALILFGILAFLQVSALILAPLVSVFVILLSQFSAGRITILEGLTSMFMPAAAEYVSSYFLVFFVGALFGAVYQYTGAAESIAHWIAGFCKGKFVAPIIFIITCVLTYGGVSGFGHVLVVTDVQGIDHFVDVGAVFDAVIQLEHQLRGVAKIQGRAQLLAQPAGGGLESAFELLLALQAHHRQPDLAVAQIAGGLHTRHADHALLNARILHVAELGRDDPLNIVVGSCQFIR